MGNGTHLFAADPEIYGKFSTRFQQMVAQKFPRYVCYVINNPARLRITLDPATLHVVEQGTMQAIDLVNYQNTRVNLLQAFAIYGHSPDTCVNPSFTLAKLHAQA